MSLTAFYALPADERDLWVARWEQAAETCPDHNGPRSECGDRDKPWFPQRHVCIPTMERQAAQATYRRIHEDAPWHDGTFQHWSKDQSRDFPYHFDHGVTIVVTETDENPEDQFLTRRRPGRVGAGEDEAEDAEPDERGEGEDGA